jgi:hypothetical protein
MIRVIANGISFYTTAARIKTRTVGSDTNLNEAIYQLYSNMFNARGIGSTMTIYDNKMQKHSYQIQIDA